MASQGNACLPLRSSARSRFAFTLPGNTKGFPGPEKNRVVIFKII
jgi:hypothetical protein